MKIIESAGYIIYRIENNEPLFLLLHYAAGHWDFPKGKVEKEESLKQAATRELLEETGITSPTIDPAFMTSFSYVLNEANIKRVTLFLASTKQANVHLSHEHQHYAWLSYNEAHVKLTYKNTKEALHFAYSELYPLRKGR